MHPHARTGQPCQIARVGTRPRRQYVVLDKEQRDLVSCCGKLLRQGGNASADPVLNVCAQARCPRRRALSEFLTPGKRLLERVTLGNPLILLKMKTAVESGVP